MKAIQIRHLAPTNTKGSRLKVWAKDVKPKIYSRNYELDPRDQAVCAAQNYALLLGWGPKISGFGSLPNGDWVATLGA
jgi:hypothetical protein